MTDAESARPCRHADTREWCVHCQRARAERAERQLADERETTARLAATCRRLQETITEIQEGAK